MEVFERHEIAMAVAVTRLRDITEGVGCEASIKPYYDEYIYLKLSGLPGRKKEVRIRVIAERPFIIWTVFE